MILIASPHTMRQEQDGTVWDSLPYWFQGIKALNGKFHTYLYLNDYTPSTDVWHEIEEVDVNYDIATVGLSPNVRSNKARHLDNFQRFADCKNACLRYARKGGYQYLFLVDSDIVLPQISLDTLLANIGPFAVLSLALNNTIRNRAKVGIQHIYNYGNRIQGKKVGVGIVNCIYTGACCLINLERVPEDVWYVSGKNGEDIPFCKELGSRGCRIGCYTNLEAYHVMNPSLIPGVQFFLEGIPTPEAYRKCPI
mgnify:CR=1 FL=1